MNTSAAYTTKSVTAPSTSSSLYMDGTRNPQPAEGTAPTAGAGLLPICVLAGGLGTRLGQLGRTVPKALVTVVDEPFVFHQLRLLADNGASSVILCVGHLGELIEKTVGPSRFGLRIRYSHDSPSLDGTLGAIRRALPLLGDRFLVLTVIRTYRLTTKMFNAGGFRADFPRS